MVKRIQPGILRIILMLLLVWLGQKITSAHAEVYGDAVTKRYHTEECAERRVIKPENIKKFDSEAEARAKNYYPCPSCNPPVGIDKKPNPGIPQRKLSQTINRGEGYIVDVAARVYHNPWCPVVKNLNPKQVRRVMEIGKAAADGNSPCATCNPPVSFVRRATTPTAGERMKNVLPPPPTQEAESEKAPK